MAALIAFAVLVHTVAGDASELPVSVSAPTEEPEDLSPAPLSPREYLYSAYGSIARRLDCMIRLESTWDPSARAGPYAGLAQFDTRTWLETPQGKAGLSRTDPYASIDALAWGVVHLGYGRWPVTSRRC